MSAESYGEIRMPLIEIKYKFDLIKRFRPVRSDPDLSVRDVLIPAGKSVSFHAGIRYGKVLFLTV
jgi:hypothetical protein